ncbi:MAG TPA: hypothetical protein VIT88_00740 [Pyrinomonadaceae bacterium]
MSDLLSSASLLIAIVTVLYGVWYPEIKRGIKDIKPKRLRDCDDIAEVKGVILNRALPLTVASVGLTLVFLKDAVILVGNSLTLTGGLRDRIMNYDAVSTAFVSVEAICLFLSLHIFLQCIRLLLNLNKLRDKENSNGEKVCP